MQMNKYICTECYPCQDDVEGCCKCETVVGTQPPSICIKSISGLVNWRCEHANLKLIKFKDAVTSLDDGIIWLTGVYKCTGCNYEQQGTTKKYKITEVNK